MEVLTKTYLKHLLNVVVLGLEQLTPGSQVAVGEDATRLQHPVGMTLGNKQAQRSQYVHQIKPCAGLVLPSFLESLIPFDYHWTNFKAMNSKYSVSINPPKPLSCYLVVHLFELPTLMKSNWWVCHVSSDRGYVSYRIPREGEEHGSFFKSLFIFFCN